MLNAKSLWHDEACSLAYARTGITYQLTRPDNAPPLYHLLLHFWLRLGTGLGMEESDFWLRLPSALAGVVAVCVTYLIGRRLAGWNMGLTLGLLTAASPLLVQYAQEARYYAFLYLFSTLSLYFYLRVKGGGTRRDWIGYGLASLLCLYTHYYSLFLLLVENLDFLLTHRRRWRTWLLAQTALAMAFLPWSLYFLWQARAAARGETFYPRPELLAVIRSYLAFVWGQGDLHFEFVLLSLLGAASLSGLALAARRRKPFVLWLLLLGVPVGLAFLISLRVPIYETKHLIASSLALHVLLGYAVALPRRRMWSIAALLIGIVPPLVFLAQYYAAPPRQDWRRTAHLVAAQAQPGDAVLFDGQVGYLGFSHYYPDDLDMYGWYRKPPVYWRTPKATVYPLAGDFWADYQELGGYYPSEPPSAAGDWQYSSEEIGNRYHRLWLVHFWGSRTSAEHEAALGVACVLAAAEPLGAWYEIRLYRCE
jgi:hypothetical protein